MSPSSADSRKPHKPNLADRKLKALTHRVFSSNHGAELLDEWRKSYVLMPTFSPDPVEMARRAAVKDFVTEIETVMVEVKEWEQ